MMRPSTTIVFRTAGTSARCSAVPAIGTRTGRTPTIHRVAARASKGGSYSSSSGDEDENEEAPAAPAFDAELLALEARAKWAEISVSGPTIAASAGALAIVVLSVSFIGVVDNVPLLPKVLEVLGLGYGAFFANKYLLFKDRREVLAKDFQEAKDRLGIY
ncbi:hypothetical protein FOA52_015619 [Chlamydomonas sp. UWO 241]|nr:hypothetical protein FOA52_015619 [Chlamydomonas sp. UWO 241]